ncbi:hypothetical protein FHETE_6209 [Fusarium heterosporum]|uniref:Uncharacterized protein n=1 Tax=Fusarium heterosporum TaxID=42747 RepID=A0A8H5T6F2_FUSHE|nr:hypothetical protein FHETE_6209 [Fusarium heterosporum]
MLFNKHNLHGDNLSPTHEPYGSLAQKHSKFRSNLWYITELPHLNEIKAYFTSSSFPGNCSRKSRTTEAYHYSPRNRSPHDQQPFFQVLKAMDAFRYFFFAVGWLALQLAVVYAAAVPEQKPTGSQQLEWEEIDRRDTIVAITAIITFLTCWLVSVLYVAFYWRSIRDDPTERYKEARGVELELVDLVTSETDTKAAEP